MAAVTTDNTGDPAPADDTFLFVNITGPTDGRRREASTQRKIRQHVMRDAAAKGFHKPSRNRRCKLNTAILASKDSSEDKTNDVKTNDVNTTGAIVHESRVEEERDHAIVTGTTAFHMGAPEADHPMIIESTIAIDRSTLDVSKQLSFEYQQPTAPLDLNLERHPLAVLYQRLVCMSQFPAYCLAYIVMQNVKLDHIPGRSFLFPFAFKEAPFCRELLTSRKVREMVRSSPEESIKIALKQFTNVLSCIRKRLANPDPNMALSDDTILAVIDSICYNFALEDLTQARCHLDGLHMMVKSRGGISRFSEKPDIQLMISWVDVTAAFIFERIPRFPLPVGLLTARAHTGTSAIWDLLNFVRDVEPQREFEQSTLFDALIEVDSIARTIESELFTRGDAVWYDSVFLGHQLNPVAHRLLSTPETDCEKQNSPISTSIRLGIALFIIILKQQSQGCPAPSTPYVSKVVGLLYQCNPKIPSHLSSSLCTLQLWLLLLCTVAYPDTTNLSDIRLMIMGIMKRSKLNSWNEVLATARLMPWISKFESRKSFGKHLVDSVL